MPTPCDLSAIEARARIRDGRLRVGDLLQSCIARIEARNPDVNAVVATDFAAARIQAAEMDKERDSGGDLPPLFGLPVLIKDLIDTKDLRTTYGSLCFETHIPEEDADIVSALRRAGAIILGKTNTPEFGAGANTFNKVFGATRNPHNLELTCGGSSGGSAVAVACGMAPLAIGSDFGGSLRIPASFCGVVGVRPTPGRVPCASLAVGNSPLWTEGPMARTVADAAMCMDVIESYSTLDPRSAPVENIAAPKPANLADLRVGVSADLGVAELDHDIRRVFEDRVTALKHLFSRLDRFEPAFEGADEVFRAIRVMDIFAGTHALSQEDRSRLGDNIKANLEQADTISLADAGRAAVLHTRMFQHFQRLFDSYDILICPATAVPPFPVDQPFPSEMNGAPLENYFSWYAVTWVLSLTGCPIVSVPCGRDHKGMPIGLQIIAPRHQDRFVLRVAEALEAQLDQQPTMPLHGHAV